MDGRRELDKEDRDTWIDMGSGVATFLASANKPGQDRTRGFFGYFKLRLGVAIQALGLRFARIGLIRELGMMALVQACLDY